MELSDTKWEVTYVSCPHCDWEHDTEDLPAPNEAFCHQCHKPLRSTPKSVQGGDSTELAELYKLAIEARDAAEETLSQAYYLITGESPNWSESFGHKEALEDIDDAQRTLRQAIQGRDALPTYEPWNESGTMLPPSPEMIDAITYEPDAPTELPARPPFLTAPDWNEYADEMERQLSSALAALSHAQEQLRKLKEGS